MQIGRALKPSRGLSSPASSSSPAASCLALLLASALLGAWVLTGGHWALSNAIGAYRLCMPLSYEATPT